MKKSYNFFTPSAAYASLAQPPADKGVTLEEAEKQLIIRTLKEGRGNRTAAARKIGISRRTLHRKLNRYGLEGI